MTYMDRIVVYGPPHNSNGIQASKLSDFFIMVVATMCEVISTLSVFTSLLKKCQELLCVLQMCYVYEKCVV